MPAQREVDPAILEGFDFEEQHAARYAEQYLGCVECKKSHHKTAFCHHCGLCFFNALNFDNSEYGDFVTCRCGEVELWD